MRQQLKPCTLTDKPLVHLYQPLQKAATATVSVLDPLLNPDGSCLSRTQLSRSSTLSKSGTASALRLCSTYSSLQWCIYLNTYSQR